MVSFAFRNIVSLVWSDLDGRKMDMAAAEHWSENHVLPSLTAANTPNKGKPQHVQKLQFTKICFVLVFLHFS